MIEYQNLLPLSKRNNQITEKRAAHLKEIRTQLNNPKQPQNKPNPKNDIKTTQNKPTDTDTDTKKEKPTPYPSREELDEALSEHVFSDAAKEHIADWVAYKHERKEDYKPIGFKRLLVQVKNHISEFGESAVFYAMNTSMAGNYQGIVWEKAKSRAPPSHNPELNENGLPPLSSYDFIPTVR